MVPLTVTDVLRSVLRTSIVSAAAGAAGGGAGGGSPILLYRSTPPHRRPAARPARAPATSSSAPAGRQFLLAPGSQVEALGDRVLVVVLAAELDRGPVV